MMNCKQVHKKLVFFIDKELVDEEMKIITSHLKECDNCMKKYEFLKNTISAIEKDKRVEQDPYFFTRLEQKIKNIREGQEQGSILLKPRIALRTALFVIIILFGIISGFLIGNFASDIVYSSSENVSGVYESDLNINEMHRETIEMSVYYK